MAYCVHLKTFSVIKPIYEKAYLFLTLNVLFFLSHIHFVIKTLETNVFTISIYTISIYQICLKEEAPLSSTKKLTNLKYGDFYSLSFVMHIVSFVLFNQRKRTQKSLPFCI